MSVLLLVHKMEEEGEENESDKNRENGVNYIFILFILRSLCKKFSCEMGVE